MLPVIGSRADIWMLYSTSLPLSRTAIRLSSWSTALMSMIFFMNVFLAVPHPVKRASLKLAHVALAGAYHLGNVVHEADDAGHLRCEDAPVENELHGMPVAVPDLFRVAQDLVLVRRCAGADDGVSQLAHERQTYLICRDPDSRGLPFRHQDLGDETRRGEDERVGPR